MNISYAQRSHVARTNPRASVTAYTTSQPDIPGESVTLSHLSSNQRSLIAATGLLGGAALGGYLLNSATGPLSGTVVNALTGAVAGAAALGLTGAFLVGKANANKGGWGGVAEGLGGLMVGGAVGAIGGGIAAAMSTGALSTVLTCTGGAMMGGILGGFVAMSINS